MSSMGNVVTNIWGAKVGHHWPRVSCCMWKTHFGAKKGRFMPRNVLVIFQSEMEKSLVLRTIKCQVFVLVVLFQTRSPVTLWDFILVVFVLQTNYILNLFRTFFFLLSTKVAFLRPSLKSKGCLNLWSYPVRNGFLFSTRARLFAAHRTLFSLRWAWHFI